MNNARALGFDWLAPAQASWALLGVLIVLAGMWSLRARARDRAALVAVPLQSRFVPGWSRNRARLRLVLAVSAAFLAALALMGPVRGYTLREVQRKGLDLVVCIDTSRSMLAQDVRPDRLTRAVREVTGLLDKLRGDRAALIAFSGDVRDVAPLTHDRATLQAFVKTLSPDDNLKGGTDIGAALERGLALFDGRTGAHEAIILVTDGEDLEGQGLTVAKKAAERGIHVYVVGMGTEGGGKIPDGARGFVRDENGQEVVTKLDGSSLEKIASATGGAYLSADSSPIPLEELYEKRITKLEGRELFAGKERIPHDRYQWPLVLAAVCMLVEAGMRERRPGRMRERAPRTREPAVEVVRGAA